MILWNWLQKLLRWSNAEEVTEVDLSRVEEEDPPPVLEVKEPKVLFYIKVIKVPDGNAPEWVREKWIGLTLPCVEETDTGGCALNPVSTWEKTLDGKGVPPRGRIFKVPIPKALAILEKKNYDAAQCFRDMLRGNCTGLFTFSVSEAERVEDTDDYTMMGI